MSNPNNCVTCDHKINPDGGHCYMFRDEPAEVCAQHTGRQKQEKTLANVVSFAGALESKNREQREKALDRLIEIAEKLRW